ncbi:MAG TPA: PAS domain S-box protein [Coleofasciculaceae cyanobacterium]
MLSAISSQLRCYGIAFFAWAIALLLTWLLQPLMTPTVFALFYPAVMVSALYGGLGPGLVAVILATLTTKYFFLPPVYSLAITNPNTFFRLTTLVLVALMISLLSTALRMAKQRAECNALRATRQQEILRQSEERFRLLVESVEDYAFFLLDSSGRVTSWNAGAERLLGYPEAEIMGNLFTCFFLPEAVEQGVPYRELQIAIASGRLESDRWYIRKDGSQFFASDITTALQDETGNLQGFTKVMRDITKCQQAQKALRESEQRYRLLTEALPQMVWIAGAEGHFEYCNQHWYNYTGLTPEQTLGDGWVIAVHPDDRSRTVARWQKAAEIVECYKVEYRQRHHNGQYRWHLASVGPLCNEKGNVIKWLGTAIDIEERKQTEAERTRLLAYEQAARAASEAARSAAERANRIKDEFLAVLSHELRTPLNPILGWAKILRTRQVDEATRARGIEIIERNAMVQTRLIEDLLDVSRIIRGKLSLTISPVNLASVLEAALDTVSLAAQAKSIEIYSSFNESAIVSGDASRLQQVVWNLLSNAVKFTPTGGRVDIQLKCFGRHAQIQVSDTGKGIDPDFLPYIFDYFRQENSSTTRAFGGLGLGLAIVDQLVELHGGTVQAQSPGIGRGATFTINLPLMNSELLAGLFKEQTEKSNSVSIEG